MVRVLVCRRNLLCGVGAGLVTKVSSSEWCARVEFLIVCRVCHRLQGFPSFGGGVSVVLVDRVLSFSSQGLVWLPGFGFLLKVLAAGCFFVWLMDPIDGITQGLTRSLAILDAEAVKVVGLDDLDGLKATCFLLVGRLLTTKDYHKDSLVGTLKRIWHTREEFSSVTLEDSKHILFSFKSDLDRKRVMMGSPWTFDKALLFLSATDGSVDPHTVSLDLQNFWVRVRGIPPLFLTPVMGEKLGNFLGTFVMVNKGLNGDCLGSFLRI
ncbi:hypothetical protein CerSpe_107580 [Prunus speciosa]